jgi:hypothetical protein
LKENHLKELMQINEKINKLENGKDAFSNKSVNTPKHFFTLKLSKNQEEIEALKDQQ